ENKSCDSVEPVHGGDVAVRSQTCDENWAYHDASVSRRLRLFHFLFEMLQDPSMAHCLSWAPAPPGVFSFSSRNKDQVAALWGQRKGNKRPMTYQKMSRALRNYARSGQIFKVKKKLTYQFRNNPKISRRSSTKLKYSCNNISKYLSLELK
uniref:Transcription factor Spi-C n=1 Tax=Poecilia reticulata TaxID=8081 RepID=A0A3P9QJI3_POERE